MTETLTRTTSIKNRSDYPEKFYNWAKKTDSITSQDTINTYWSQIKDLPDFDLRTLYQADADHENPVRLEEKKRDQLAGLLDRNISSDHQLQALRRLIDCKLHYIKNDDSVTDLEYMRIKTRKGQLTDSIDVDETRQGSDYETIEKHYIHKDDLVELLRRAKPVRARYWASTYLLGVRWKASKTLADDPFFSDRGEHGVVRIPEERTKSTEPRDIQLYTDRFWRVIDSAPQGKWVDRHDRTWTDVYFPSRTQHKENYQLGKRVDGKVYGLAGEIGLSPRSIHSLRHTRITDLLKAESLRIKEVQDRAGHSQTSSTNHYTETSFSREPLSLEQYLERNDLDLMEIVAQ